MGKNDLTGRWGEGLAADYLRRRGYRLLACNYRCRFGEIDIIAEKRGCVVFCEVKTWQDDRFAQAMEFVDSHKQRRLRATAEFWLAQQEQDWAVRFDVIEIYAPEGSDTRRPKIQQIKDAFV